MGCVKWAVCVCLFGQLFIRLFPSSLRGGERRGLRVQLSSLVDFVFRTSPLLWLGRRWIFSYSAFCYPRKAGKKFARDSFSQCDHSCQWKRNEQLNLVIGFFVAQPGARADAVPKFVCLNFSFPPRWLGFGAEAQPKLFDLLAPNSDSP